VSPSSSLAYLVFERRRRRDREGGGGRNELELKAQNLKAHLSSPLIFPFSFQRAEVPFT